MTDAVRVHGKKSLRRQVYIITVVVLLVIIMAGIAIYAFVSNLLAQKELRHVDSVVRQLSVELSTLATSQAQITNNLVLNQSLLSYLHADTPSKRFVYWQSFSDTINTLITLNETVEIMLIFDNNRLLLNRSKNNTSYSIVYAIEEQFSLYTDRLDIYSGPIYDRRGQSVYYAYLRSVYDNSEGGKIGQKLGTIVLLSPLTKLQHIMQNASLTESAVFAILDQDGNPVIAGDDVLAYMDEGALAGLPPHERANQTIAVGGKNLLIYTEPVPQMGWQIASFIPLSELNADLQQFILYACAFLICVVLAFFLVMLHVLKNIMKPISQIAVFTQHSAEYNLKHRIHGIADNEIGQLSTYINGMLDAVDDLTHRLLLGQQEVHASEMAKVQAEYSALQSQINPHFLYNTLDCMKGYGYKMGSQEVVCIANNLSSIMRYCIKGPEIVTIDMELDNVRKYLDIIRMRFGNRFQFKFDITEDLLGLPIPRLILQPIVENAIHHGLEPKVGQGTLQIDLLRQDAMVTLIVQDDGVGMTEAEVLQLHKTMTDDPLTSCASIGLPNVYRRLRHVFGQGVSYSVISSPGEGTTIVFSFVIPPGS